MKKHLLAAATALLLMYISAHGQVGEPVIPRSYNNEPVKNVFDDVRKYTGYTNVIDKSLFPRLKTFTSKRPFITLANLIMELNKQTQLYFWRDDSQKFIYAKVKDVKGKVVDENDEPQEGITVRTRDTIIKTNTNGDYLLPGAVFVPEIFFTGVSKEPVSIKVNQRAEMPLVRMLVKANDLEEVKVFNTGYTVAAKERLTGSFAFLSRKQIERSIASSVLQSMQGKVAGMLFIENRQSGSLLPAIQIRGSSTIFSDAMPLIIVDNYQFAGDINDINPNDIENVTFLKDAAAASIWGARAANGVIVITTKKGSYARRLQVTANTSFSFYAKPDLFYMPRLKPEDYIEVEQARYKEGYYNVALSNDYSPVSPVVEILHLYDSSRIIAQEKFSRLNSLANYDLRNDMDAYFYRPGFIERYFASVRKGNGKVGYYGSVGYDREKAEQLWTTFDRITSQHNLLYRGKKFELSGKLTGIFSRSKNDQPLPQIPMLIGRLVDSVGRPSPVTSDVRQSYKDQLRPFLPDWDYRPIDELNKNNLKQSRNYIEASLMLRDTIVKGLTLSAMYQFVRTTEIVKNEQGADSYFARDLRNKTARFVNNAVEFVLPKGGILTWQDMGRNIHNARLQLNFDKVDSSRFTVATLAGLDFSRTDADTFSLHIYGYEKDHGYFPVLNYATSYPFFYNPAQSAQTPFDIISRTGLDVYKALFGNAAVTYKDRLAFSVSGRFDESNLFGVKAKQKRIPLWSAGVKYEVMKDCLFNINWLSYLNLRLTAGTNGNIQKSMSAYTTAGRSPANRYGSSTVSISSPANEYLRWEKSLMYNVGLDWADASRHYIFSFDYYWRKSDYLFAPSFQESTYGYRMLWDNVAALKGRGFDFMLNTVHDVGDFKIRNNLFFSQAINKVTRYEQTLTRASQFTDPQIVTPRLGYPVYGLYAFPSAGLNPQTGDPQGYNNGAISNNYTAIVNGPADNLKYVGSAVPVFFGGLSSLFSYKQIELSATITGKFKYFFRRGVMSSLDPFGVLIKGNYDYAERWKEPGDEEHTKVPSYKVWPEENRDYFYQNSTATIERADHIRLHEVKVSYDLKKWLFEKYRLRSCVVYAYVSNVGIIWKATRSGADPDSLYGYPQKRMYTLGARFEL
jgi:TonB-linked SusC/RagA family outer membrane protein